MEKLKTRNGLTIVAGVCIVISVCAGFGFLSAANGVNCMWHCMFPQYMESNEPTALSQLQTGTRTVRAVKDLGTGATAAGSPSDP